MRIISRNKKVRFCVRLEGEFFKYIFHCLYIPTIDNVKIC